MMHSGRTTRPKSASAANRRASQKPGPLSELGLLHPADWEFGETVCSNKLVDQHSCRRGCTAMLVQGSASISDKLLPQSRIAQQIGDSTSQLIRRIEWIVPPPTRSSVANDAHRRVVHESACRRPTPCGIDLPTINDTNGRHSCRADAAYFDALRDERTRDENRLLNHFFVSFRAGLNRRIGKRGAGRD